MARGIHKLMKNASARSAAAIVMALAAAGCSSDVTRLTDNFYSGAVPQSSQTLPPLQSAQAGQGTPVDSTSTGSIGQTFPAATGSVERSQLPPPSQAAYQPSVQPGVNGQADMQPMTASAPPQAAPSTQTAGSVPQQRPATAPVQTASAPAPVQPAPQQTAAASNGRTVTVQSGDSLNAIARRTGVSVADLRAANGLATDNIRIGQTLNLPGNSQNTQVAALGSPPSTLQAQAAATPAPAPAQPAAAQPAPAPAAPAPAAPAATPAASAPAPAASAPAASSTVEAQSQVAAVAPASSGISQFRWPVQGRVVRGFGDRNGSRRSDGLDISVPQGSPVKAAENGVVIYAGEGLKEFGKTVLIRHDNGLVTVYGHADEILVERGATVRRGQDIAKAGMTGDTDVPMLHFEVRKDSTPVDPTQFLGS